MAPEVGTIEFFTSEWERRTPSDLDTAFAIDLLSRMREDGNTLEEAARRMSLGIDYARWLVWMTRWPYGD